MIRLSSGTAAALGLAGNRMDAFPTTAYLLSGKSCLMNCAFCPQGSAAGDTLNRLGRINWPEYPRAAVETALKGASEKGIRRICLQSVRHHEGIKPLLEEIKLLKTVTPLPLSLSAWISDSYEAGKIFAAGVDRISISIDVINPIQFSKIKGGSQQKRLKLLFSCAENFPGKITTHLIHGLGESEYEALYLIDSLLKAGVTIGLFAFVPLRGTVLEDANAPDPDSYRRIQAGLYLLRSGLASFAGFKFNSGRIISYGLSDDKLIDCLGYGRAFETTGCPDCNRPYYNERPGGTIYNYHRPLKSEEIKHALTLALGRADFYINGELRRIGMCE